MIDTLQNGIFVENFARSPRHVRMRNSGRSVVVLLLLLFAVVSPERARAQTPPVDHFRQLDEIWPTPNDLRRPSGAPGKAYWQQRADYLIKVRLDDKKQTLTGSEQITYHNNSPDSLSYLWVQLDQQRYEPDSHDWLTANAPDMAKLTYKGLGGVLYRNDFKGGHRITAVEAYGGEPLKYTLVHSMMRIDLDEPLPSGGRIVFSIDWNYQITDAKKIRVRGGFEYFKEDKNYLYSLAQWYPRMCAYTDVHGWQNKQSIGSEFTVEFGDFVARITVPEDHIVAATGELQNVNDVLTEEQRLRLDLARKAKEPVMIVTKEEAVANESSKPKGEKTWVFKAKQVRDFAFASSRKFLWDAQGIDLNGRQIMAMSFWPKEGEPLWSKYSTAAVVHTVETYSKFTFDYPYPVVQSVNGPISGMEYPMITFQSPRPEKDGTYSERTKIGLIGVIIHEVGHNWFPMVVNSDERRWRWMDEGLNSFVQFLSEHEWSDDYPTRLTDPERRKGFYAYLQQANKMPIMTTADSLISGGYNAYTKPTQALIVLRETILGREVFDFAFKEYANRWKFKRPTPYDFFRTIEDASGRDLDWFWRGWFYSTDHVDIAIADVSRYTLDTRDPEIEKARKRKQRDQKPESLVVERNREIEKRMDRNPELKDFYDKYDELAVVPHEKEAFAKLLKALTPEERELLKTKGNFYVIDLENIGGVVMPVILEVEFVDGKKQTLRIPAEIWRRNGEKVSRLLHSRKEVRSVTLDPRDETVDLDRRNNVFPRQMKEQTLRLQKSPKSKNPMQRAKDAEARKSKTKKGKK
ncbi:MAG: hypothetical protein ACI9VS_002551 [Candidatus Binatia bacterium]